jgi:hypothetical protein
MRARVLELARGALAALEPNRERIDDLNVFPVPDGDTGTNLVLTVQALVDDLAAPGADERGALAAEVTRSALMGARGNSGVILSQAIRGAAESLGRGGNLAEALRGASDAAYRGVRQPVEGTMLTALRELADEAERGGDLASIVARGDDCVARTTGQLPVLKEAGVVDAGAAGLIEIARGIAGVLTGAPLPAPAGRLVPTASAAELVHWDLSRYRYCTVFVVEGEGLDVDTIERELEPLGDSLLVVGDSAAVKAHLHTDDPGRALSLGVAHGSLAGIEISDMHSQTQARARRLLHAVPQAAAACDAIAVANGAGNRRLFESLGARIVDGGRTMNPSTSDILAAIEASPAPEAVVLPNDPNVLMGAEQAAAHASKPVWIVRSSSVQAGLAAMVAFDPTRAAGSNAEAMEEALASVATGAVTIASRDIDTNGVVVRKGAWLGLVEGEPVAAGPSFDSVTGAVLARLLAEPRGVLTFLTGEQPPAIERLLDDLSSRHPELELEVHEGGQPHYALLLSAE